MFFRNAFLTAAELSHTSKPVLLKQTVNKNEYLRLQKSIHNSRCRSSRGRSAGFEPECLENIKGDYGPLHTRGLVKPLLFTIGVSSVSLAGCAIWEYESLHSHATNLLRKPGSWLSAQHKNFLQHRRQEPGPLRKWWNSLRDNEKVFYPILAANVLVFGAWRVRALQPMMIKYFCSNPTGRAVCLPMVLSTFSHYSPLHLAANMYVLYTFMPAAVAALGREQFVGLYLSAGVISSFSSFLYKVMLSQPGLSLGASGAIMAILAYVCVQYPDTKLSIIFLPMYTFAAGTAIKALMGVDLAGIVLRWKLFDHAAHLGGALLGVAWCYWGCSHVWGNRDKFQQYYHFLRHKESSR